ncbi:peroxidase family protein [Bosea sp. TAF32]|uniref:peroxidase family protein n=1 Tax=Bosea sp. TAF32 TaxID=3237482 RepID=UPI003F916EA6
MVNIVRHDLEFILRQIKIAEAHSSGTPLDQIYVNDQGDIVPEGTAGTVLAISHPLAPYGLRTVDGSYNNLVAGREEWGAADNSFPRITTPSYRAEGDDSISFGPGGTVGGNYGPTGSVADADPRIISNLIVDQTLDNPAAIYAALVYAGLSGGALNAALQAIVQAKAALDAAIAAGPGQAATIAALQAEVTTAGGALTDAQADAADAAAALQAAAAASTVEQDELAAAQQATAQAEATFSALMADGDNSPAGQAAEQAALAAWQAAQLAEDQAVAEANAAASAVAGAQSVVVQANAAVLAATAELATAQANLAAAQHVELAETQLDTLLQTHGVEMEGNTVIIPNVAPDEGLSAPYNSWFTLFGQFFDHGLDLVQKGGNGTIYIPLQPDDPLYDPAHPETNFMVLTRAPTNATNLTTPWVDQNQTYTSSGSHQLFLREYAMVSDPDFPGLVPVATGKLLEGTRGQPQGEHGGLATWADVKAQARAVLGIELADSDVLNVPLFVMDDYGQFVRGQNGFPQMVTSLGADNKFGGSGADADTVVEGNPAAPISTAGAVRTGHAFLDDIAHAAVPGLVDHDRNPATPMILKTADTDDAAGNEIPVNEFGVAVTYDNELLDAHYITGDGRGNENIGLSAVHHIFHSEHNRTVQQIKEKALAAADLAFLNEWLLTDVAALPTNPQAIAALQWDGERLFQAARFSTEMQYQHLVFEEFARKIQPDVDAFVFNPSTDINPAIFAEFAHVVYRFGHSMLREEIAVTNADGSDGSLALFDAFLNPLAFGSATVDHAAAAGAIVRGMTSQVGNEIDEFVTHVLRNQLVGIPLDLAALNIARGREAGIPSLNEARAQFKEVANGDTQLDPYTSWTDFALNLKNPASIVNFIAAYGTHSTIVAATTTDAKRDAAMKLVFGGTGAPADRLDFLNAKGAYAGGSLGGLNDVDLWVGGLAEKKMAFGGMLGSTFSFIFELQLENLQNGDRFYYLSRVQGLNFLNELENNSFAKMVLANTDLGAQGYAVPGDIFSVPDHVIYLDAREQAKFGIAEPENDDPFLEALSSFVERRDAAGNLIEYERNPDGTFVRDQAGNVIVAAGSQGAGQIAAHLRVNSNDHVLIQGTNGNDVIIAGGGDDSVWGRGGNDRIEAGYGVDKIHGGDGDDIITNSGTDIGEVDMLHGEAGNDVIHGGSGLALLFGNEGKDVLIAGPDGKEAFGGLGDDFILGGEGGDFLLGNEGDDWIEGGGGFDTTAGDNSELFFNSTIIGHDVMFAGTDEHDFDAESGDDIMVQGESVMRNEGMLGFDWAIHKGNNQNAESDLLVPIFTTDQQDILRDRFDAVEALSGWDKNDTLKGDNRADPALGGEGGGGLAGAENTMTGHQLTQAGVDRITGLRDVLGNWVAAAPAGSTAEQREQIVAFDDGNILLGGGGSDTIEGRGGNDVIDGDAWLNVRIAIRDTNGVEIATTDGLAKPIALTEAGLALGYQGWAGEPLHTLMLSGAINPVQLNIVREIRATNGAGDVDTAVFSDNFANYTITRDSDGSLLVSHDTVTVGLTSDGTDKLWNIEQLRFADRTVSLSAPQLSLNAYDPGGNYADNFGTANYGNSNGSLNWGPDWVETGDDGSATSANGQIRINGGTLQFDAGNGATLERAVDLSAASFARLSFQANPDNLDAGEQVAVFFAADGVNFVELATITGDGGATQHSFELAGPFAATAALRFVASNISAANELVSIDNLSIDLQRPAVAPTVNHQATFTEGGAGVAIASLPGITEDSGTINAATVTLTNAQAGDSLSAPATLPGGITRTIDTSVPGVVTIRMTGAASVANYQAAIQMVTFSNSSQDPGAIDRVVHVSVTDTLLSSNVAVSTIHVVPVNDAPVASNDTVITNFATVPFAIPEWALLANDTDADSAALDITAAQINNASLAAISLTANPGSVTVTDNAQAGGTFTYTASDGTATDTAQVTITRDTTGTIDGTAAANILIGDGGNSTFAGGGGNDVILAGAGNDTINWSAGVLTNDGRDFVDGGAGTLDRFVVNGSILAETFVVYARAAAPAAIVATLRPETEIVITRNGAVIAELDNIEEITINTGLGADTVQAVGDFSPTSLNFNTITINGDGGDDTVDISTLASAHRIVFRSNGGNDTIVGTLRPQDVIELPDGALPEDYEFTTDENGVTTMTSATHSICFTAGDEGLPQFGSGNHPDDDDDDDDAPTYPGDDENDDEDPVGSGDDDDDDDDDDPSCGCDDDDDGPGTPAPNPNPASGGTLRSGTAAADVLIGTAGADNIIGLGGDDTLTGEAGADAISAGEGADFVDAGDGRDVVFAGAGDDQVFGGGGADMLYGEAGNDRIFGGAGNDLIDAGAGKDTVVGGSGDDLMIGTAGDDDDTYFGDEIDGGSGSDTLDFSTITANLTVDLGNGALGRGSAVSSQTGTDTLWSIENVATGSGNDTITASDAVNVMEGGSGNDTFRFLSTQGADGDTILDFQPGDRLDLSAIDADASQAGNQSFTLANGGSFTASAQLTVTYETRADGDYTIVKGNVDAATDAEFQINLKGSHNLTAGSFIV